MATSTTRKSPWVGYPIGLLIWGGAFVLGNILGRIIASMNGWDNFSYDRAGGVFYAGIQGGLGSYLALVGAKNWLGDGQFVRFWLLAFVLITGALLVFGSIAAVYLGRTEIFGWSLLASAVATAVTEFVRRIPESDL